MPSHSVAALTLVLDILALSVSQLPCESRGWWPVGVCVWGGYSEFRGKNGGGIYCLRQADISRAFSRVPRQLHRVTGHPSLGRGRAPSKGPVPVNHSPWPRLVSCPNVTQQDLRSGESRDQLSWACRENITRKGTGA